MRKVFSLSAAFFILLVIPILNTSEEPTGKEVLSLHLVQRLCAEEEPVAEAEDETLQDIDLGTTGLEDFVLFICRVLDVQVVYDKQIFPSNKKYMFKFQPQPVNRLFPLLRNTLDLYGYRLLSIGNADKPVYYIFQKDNPAAFKVPPPNLLLDGEKIRPDQFTVKFLKLKHASANYLVNQLRTLTGVNQKSLQAYPATNEIAITDFPDRVAYYERLIRERDVKEAKLKTVVVNLRYVKSAILLKVVKQHLAAVAAVSSNGTRKGGMGGMLQTMTTAYKSPAEFTAVEEPNKIIFTAPEHEAGKIEDFIRKFDVEIKAPEKEVITEIYAPKHIDLEEAADVVAQIFGSDNIDLSRDDEEKSESKSKSSSDSGSTSTSKAEKANTGNFMLEEFEVPTVVIQQHSTTLVITTSRRIHEKIKELLDVLDTKTPQIFLEAALVSIAYDTDLTIATELSTIQMLRTGCQVFSATDFGLSKLTPVPGFTLDGRMDFRRGGLTFGIAKDNANVIPGLIRLSKTTSKVKVLSNPSVFADNNREATFSTTDYQPYASRTSDDTGEQTVTQGGTETATIEVKIKPTIYKGKTLRLDITLKVEAFSAPPANEYVAPPKTSNVYAGILSVADGKTIVLGGLVLEGDSITETKVPILGDIPLLGYLFKSQTRMRKRSVLYLFITPKIMKMTDYEDLENLKKQKEELLKNLTIGKKKKLTIGKK